MLKIFSGGFRQLKQSIETSFTALVKDQSGNVFTMLFGAVALTGVLAGVGMQTINMFVSSRLKAPLSVQTG